MNPEQKVIAVATISDDRLTETHRHQFLHGCSRYLTGSFLLSLGRTDTAWPYGIGIHQNPLVSDNVIIAGCYVRALNQPFMLFSGIAPLLDSVQCLIKGSVRIPTELRLNGRTVCPEVAADDRLWLNAPNFYNVLRGVEEGKPVYRETHSSSSSSSAGIR